ncbi:MAG: Crp/Fnr family transcriptional regulator [Clostridia bacterium]|nr:Crp/Fnr family transcriptional regulator [Clostridia bacterium]
MHDFVFSQFSVFSRIPSEFLPDVAAELDIRTARFPKNTVVLRTGTRSRRMGMVLSGSVTIQRLDYLGNRWLLGFGGRGEIFGETYALISREPMMVDVVANEDCEILYLDLSRIFSSDLMKKPWYAPFLQSLLHITAEKNLELSLHSFHTFPKTVRGRLLSYFKTQTLCAGKTEFDIPLNRQQLADYLNLDRSALSGELGKMRDEGLLTFHKNHFSLTPAGMAGLPEEE